MNQLTTCICLMLSVLTLCESYTIIYKNSEKFCSGNRYTHIYDYLKENKYCFKIQWCDEEHCCIHECGAYSWRAKHVKILQSEIIPQNAFADSEHLLHIAGVQQKISTLASKSFVNLENIIDIYLSFNNIRYLQHDVFMNVSASILDLSWNKLIYIEQDAFDGLPNLKLLNLSHNELSYVYAFSEGSVLTNLILSYNYLQRLVISSVRYPVLEILDASYNNLTNIAITSKNNMQLIDLRNNDIEQLDVLNIQKVTELNIGVNKLTDIDESICDKVERVSIFPNPWDCSRIQTIMSKCSDSDHSTSDIKTICVNSKTEKSETGDVSNSLVETIKYVCGDDEMCPDDQICRSNKCIDPCKENVCDSTSICKTAKHVFSCDCPGHFKRNPVEFNSPCYDVQCFVDEDCLDDIPCNITDHICDSTKSITYSKASSVVGTYPWYYDKTDPILGEISYVQNFHRTENKHSRNRN